MLSVTSFGDFGELVFDHALVYARDYSRDQREHVNDEKLTLEAFLDVVFSSAWVGHSGDLKRLGDLAEPRLFSTLEELEALVLDRLAH